MESCSSDESADSEVLSFCDVSVKPIRRISSESTWKSCSASTPFFGVKGSDNREDPSTVVRENFASVKGAEAALATLAMTRLTRAMNRRPALPLPAIMMLQRSVSS